MSELDQYIPQRRNANRHTQRGMRELEQSVQSDGWIGAMTAAADGEIFDGSARREVVETALHVDPIVVESDGTRPIIIQRTDIPRADDPRAIRLGLAANKIAADNLDWDAALLKELHDQDASLLEGLFNSDELDALMATMDQPIVPGNDGDEFDTTPAEGPTRTQVGDLWQMGRHRLLVGDCTDPANVARLMDGEKVDMMWSDPPYGIDYTGKDPKAMKIQNDGAAGLSVLLQGAFACADVALMDGAAIYIAHPPGAQSVTFGNSFIGQGWKLRQILVWVKHSLVLGHSDYHYKHEAIMFGYKPGSGRRGRGGEGWYGDNSQTSVFEVNRPVASHDHPTEKPILLLEPMIRNSSPYQGSIYDPFLGSGTTLIAAERTGRTCYGCEIEPRYADVVLRRWEAETGKTAERIGL